MADVLSTPAAPDLSATSDMPTLPAAQPNSSSSDAGSGDAPGADAGEADAGGDAGEGDAAAKAAPDAGEGESSEGGDKKPPKKGIQERFSDLTAARKEADARAAAANENVTKLTAVVETQAQQLAEALKAIKEAGGSKEGDAIRAAEEADPRPKRDTFEHPDQYEDALVQWSVRQGARAASAEYEKKQLESQQADAAEKQKKAEEEAEANKQRQFEETTKAWGERRAKVIEQIPDYAEVAESPDVQITAAMGAMIINSELGPQMAYHLGKNPAEAARIAALPPPQQIFEMGRVAALVTQQAAKPKPPPEPITRTGTRAAAAQKSADEMSGDEYYEKRSPELRARRN